MIAGQRAATGRFQPTTESRNPRAVEGHNRGLNERDCLMSTMTATRIVDDRVAEVLIGAQLLINESGWIQVRHGDREQGFCTSGAISTAAHDLFGEHGIGFVNRMYHAAMQAVQVVTRSRNVADWNDWHGRTQPQVLEALRNARMDVLENGVDS